MSFVDTGDWYARYNKDFQKVEHLNALLFFKVFKKGEPFKCADVFQSFQKAEHLNALLFVKLSYI